jgi:predicted NACHT family NTPase
MIKELLFKKALEASFDAAKRFLLVSRRELLTTPEQLEESLRLHEQSVSNWAAQISFNELKRSKRLSDTYTELDLFVYPQRLRIHSREYIATIPLCQIFDHAERHIVLLGQPGAGKTTSMKHLCQTLFTTDDFHYDRFSLPIVVKLRDLNSTTQSGQTSLLDHIWAVLGLRLPTEHEPPDPKAAIEQAQIHALKKRLVPIVLDELKALLILDGFDELASTDLRDTTLALVRDLAVGLGGAALIITCRTGDFVFNIENAETFELSPLTKNQVKVFATRWLPQQTAATDFLHQVNQSPFADSTMRPLTLAHLCAIYERTGEIPDKPKTVYKKIVNLLLEKWDEERSVKRRSAYANFQTERKFDFLCSTAYLLTTVLRKTTVFSIDDLLTVYNTTHADFGLPAHEAKQVVSELETHTGLLLQSGFERFEFAHKSFQEYLTAEYLVRLPSIPSGKEALGDIPNELAIAVAISSNPTAYFTELVNTKFGSMLPETFLLSFVTRLMLEKPDLNPTHQLAESILVLHWMFTQYPNSQFSVASMHELERLIKAARCEAVILETVGDWYVQTGSYTSGHNEQIICFVRRAAVAQRTPKSYLPISVQLRKSFLDAIGGAPTDAVQEQAAQPQETPSGKT